MLTAVRLAPASDSHKSSSRHMLIQPAGVQAKDAGLIDDRN